MFKLASRPIITKIKLSCMIVIFFYNFELNHSPLLIEDLFWLLAVSISHHDAHLIYFHNSLIYLNETFYLFK